MKRKSLLFGLLAVLSAVLIFTGCANPADGSNGVNGDDGAPGDPGKVFLTGAVTAEELADAFEKAEEVVLQRGIASTTVYGVIPANKTLVVYGQKTVLASKSLDVQGTLEITANATLDAGGVSSGYLAANPASITGTGVLVLPYTNSTYAVYDSVNYAGKAAVGLSAASVAAIFVAQGAPDSLTVYNLTAIDAGAVPATKTLNLAGPLNTVTGALDLSATTAGTLVVKNGAVLTVSHATGVVITGKTTANITVEGTLALASGVIAFSVLGGVDLSKATVDASLISSAATLTMPTGDAAIGAITEHTTNALTITGPTGLIVGSITGGTGGVKGTNITKYTVAGGTTDYVSLATADATNFIVSNLSGKTFTLVGTPTIGSLLTIGGAAKLKGSFTTAVANFALTTENLGKLASGSSVTYSDAATVSAPLTIPAGITVTGSAALTLNSAGSITVEGTLIAKGAVGLSAPVTIGASGKFALDTGKVITLAAATAEIVGGTYEITTTGTAETLTAGIASTAVVFANDAIQGTDASYDDLAAATAATLVFAGTADPTLTIKENTTIAGVILDVSTKGIISVAASRTLTLAHAGTSGAASGGIFTKAGASGGAKANGVNSVELTANTLAGLAAVKVAATAAADAAGGATPADGKIGAIAAIDIADTFAVGASNAITVTHN